MFKFLFILILKVHGAVAVGLKILTRMLNSILSTKEDPGIKKEAACKKHRTFLMVFNNSPIKKKCLLAVWLIGNTYYFVSFKTIGLLGNAYYFPAVSQLLRVYNKSFKSMFWGLTKKNNR